MFPKRTPLPPINRPVFCKPPNCIGTTSIRVVDAGLSYHLESKDGKSDLSVELAVGDSRRFQLLLKKNVRPSAIVSKDFECVDFRLIAVFTSRVSKKNFPVILQEFSGSLREFQNEKNEVSLEFSKACRLVGAPQPVLQNIT